MTAKKGVEKPNKPRRNFPLRAHSNGQWVKTVNGRVITFGPWDDPEGAEAAWHTYSLNKNRPASASTSLEQLCNSFLSARLAKHRDGDLSARQLLDLERACNRAKRVLGPSTPLSEIDIEEFGLIAADIRLKHESPNSIRRETANCKTMFNYASKQKLIDRPFVFGEVFAVPSTKAIRRYEKGKPDKNFSPEECRKIVAKASGVMKCFILLGLNMGAGNSDLRTMERGDIEDGWYDGLRNKTLVPRRAKLWDETVEALENYKRPRPKEEKNKELLFLTKHGGNPYGTGLSGSDPIGQTFKKFLLRETEINGSFYGFRHTFETLASGCRDQQAIDLVMGHVDNSMAARYRTSIEDDRMVELSTYVHKKIFG